MPSLPDSIPKKHLHSAIAKLKNHEPSRFADSTGYDVEFEGGRYAPKAVVGLAAEEFTGEPFGPYDFKGGWGSRCFRILEKGRFNIVRKGAVRLGWIFQGNPKKFDIDDYLSRYSYIYWSAPTFGSKIERGDYCFVWRSGQDRGVIAVGIVSELAQEMRHVTHPECLGNDLWREEADEPSSTKVGIKIVDYRLDSDAGFLPHDAFASHPNLGTLPIVINPQGTVFALQPEEAQAVLKMWGIAAEPSSPDLPNALEGTKRLRQHFVRERNQTLIELKKSDFANQHSGRVFCEVCNFDFDTYYPADFKRGYIEAHHLAPLSTSDEPRWTAFADLLLVCSNCHRMIHHNNDVEKNLAALREHFTHHPMN